MNKSFLALATLAAFTGAAQAETQSNPVSSGTSIANVPTTEASAANTTGGTVGNTNPSRVIVIAELQIATVAVACGCYPNYCN